MKTDYELFTQNIKNKSGIDLGLYKESQMKRRLISLYEKRGFSSFTEYFRAIDADTELFYEFLDRMTINVSEFYRNAKRWDVLDKQILPELIAKNKNLKIWSAACSTGEEPFTLAMVVAKHIPLEKVKIIATDIDENVIRKAKAGIYSDRAIGELPIELRNKYFTRDNNYYKLNDEIKRTIIFKKHNLLADPYDNDFDLIICRNVLIYFTEEAKDSIYSKFSNSLRKDGILFVGSTEQIFNPSNYNFSTIESFFYKKNK
ncbi:MAG: chemotaxis protein CheR [Bacillales bacterium]|jgi:chemotaxis protein methyltransferase CheR|nr:chemotaxis protein CheR [Bacillales bacterium]